MPKLRVDRGDMVWVLDNKAYKIAERNCLNREDQTFIMAELLSSWQEGTHGFMISYMPFSTRHRWIWLHMGDRKLRVHDTEVVRM